MEVVPQEEARFLLRSSLTVLTSCAFAAYFGFYDFLMTSTAVLLCSINYWRRPVYGWRRNIDMLNITVCTLYHTWRALQLSGVYFFGYIGFVTIGVTCYVIGRSLQVLGAYAHSGMHISGNIANAFLYTGMYSGRPAASHILLITMAILGVIWLSFTPLRHQTDSPCERLED